MLTVTQVYIAEPTAYWTGRYISLCDQLRMKELKKPLHSPSESSEKQVDLLFEKSEKCRMNSALTDLRDHCKTTEALRGFEEFEGVLLKRLGVSRQALNRASAPVSDEGEEKESTNSRTLAVSRSMSKMPCTPSSPVSRISSVNAEAIMAGASKSFYGEGTIKKSKTTGNLLSLAPMVPKRRYSIIARPPSHPVPSQQVSHRRKASYFECSPESRAKAMREREQRAARRAAQVHRRSTSQHMSAAGLNSRQPSGKNTSIAESTRPQPRSYNSKVDSGDQVSFSLSAAALESGHGVPPPVPPVKMVPLRVEMVNVSSGGQEKVIKSRHKPERQSSGDRMKNLLGASVREVKKMGRRVSGMSWPGSGEE
jgi:hypothetical protein